MTEQAESVSGATEPTRCPHCDAALVPTDVALGDVGTSADAAAEGLPVSPADRCANPDCPSKGAVDGAAVAEELRRLEPHTRLRPSSPAEED